MCGIAGIFHTDGRPVDPALPARMAQMLEHRGPDDSGVWIERNVGLAHRRLAVIDPVGGRQPASSADGRAIITYNGEAYNFRELRADLENAGYAFQTQCDTEVLVNLYVEVGETFPERINGMFALGIWDRRERKLILVRDRFGQKPLYYFFRDGTLAFASELRGLLVCPECPRTIRAQSVHDYLTYQYVPTPHTIFCGVRKLPPGSILICREGQTEEPIPRRWWRLDYSRTSSFPSIEAAGESLAPLLQDAVARRMIADVPLGAFLSGGIDSTITAGLMTRCASGPVRTFTIGFPEEKYDERRYAEHVARSFGVEYHVRVVEPRDLAVLQRLVRHYGEPYSDASMLPTARLAEFTREHVTVALSGDGADELFGGYYRYVVMAVTRFLDFLPAEARHTVLRPLLAFLPPKTEERTLSGRLRRLLELGLSPDFRRRYLDLISRFPETLKYRVYGPALADCDLQDSYEVLRAAFDAATSPHPVERVSEVDVLTYLPGDILAKVDIASMAYSLEVRSPFLDHRVAEFAASLPWHWKQHRTQRKRILRRAFSDLLPHQIRRRPKIGFGVPVARWFRQGWRRPLEEVLLDPATRRRGWVDSSAVATLIREHCELRADHSYALWALFLLELWFREVLDNSPPSSKSIDSDTQNRPS